jgi:hypothetical protein
LNITDIGLADDSIIGLNASQCDKKGYNLQHVKGWLNLYQLFS